MLTIKTLQGTHRMSTQDLLLAVEEAVGNGETSFEIEASGQHDIGGPLWNRDGKKLTFRVSNPGQRVGSMCLPDTEIVVEGPAPAELTIMQGDRPDEIFQGVGDFACLYFFFDVDVVMLFLFPILTRFSCPI